MFKYIDQLLGYVARVAEAGDLGLGDIVHALSGNFQVLGKEGFLVLLATFDDDLFDGRLVSLDGLVGLVLELGDLLWSSLRCFLQAC